MKTRMTPYLACALPVAFSMAALACSAASEDASEATGALVAPTASCAATSSSLALAKKIASIVVSSESSSTTDDFAATGPSPSSSSSSATDNPDVGKPTGSSTSTAPTPSATNETSPAPSAGPERGPELTCSTVAPGVIANVASLEAQLLAGVKGCSTLSATITTDAAFAQVREALRGTLSLALATGALTADGTGLKAILDGGVQVYDLGTKELGSTHRITFARGKATLATLVKQSAQEDPVTDPGQGAPSEVASGDEVSWVAAGAADYVVNGSSISIGKATYAFSVGADGVVLKSTEGTYFDHERECN